MLSYIARHIRFRWFSANEVAVAREQACPADEQAIVGFTSDDSIRIDLEDRSISANMKFLPMGLNAYEERGISVKHRIKKESPGRTSAYSLTQRIVHKLQADALILGPLSNSEQYPPR
jgi:hypothetical protein